MRFRSLRPRIRRRILLPILAIALAIAPSSGTATALELYTAGHADLAVRNPGGGNTLEFVYDLSANAVINGSTIETARFENPSLIATVVPESSTLTLPGTFSSPYWRNRQIWYLPSGAVAGVPDLGIGKILTENVFVNDAVTLSFDSFVSRPANGEFFLGNFNATTLYIDTAPGATAPNALPMTDHSHYIWSFSEQGQYQIRFRADATLIQGNTPVTAFATYTFNVVVPEPSTWALAGIGVLALGCLARTDRRKRRTVRPA